MHLKGSSANISSSANQFCLLTCNSDIYSPVCCSYGDNELAVATDVIYIGAYVVFLSMLGFVCTGYM